MIDENRAAGFAAHDGVGAPEAEQRRMGVAELAGLARQFYVGGRWLTRQTMHHRIVICPFERLIPHVASGASVLDVGCGAGLFLALLAGALPEVAGVGFDSSRTAIETAVRMTERIKLSGLRAELRFIQLDVAEPWPAGLFDVVSLVDVLHHVPRAHQKSVVERAARKVKPGGVLIYKDMGNRPAFHAWMNRLHDLLMARQWIHYVPIRHVDEWAEESGLALAHAEAISRLWYRHELRIYNRRIRRSESQREDQG
jgi:2-polyprenyl-3-methyl-5-hydroxy-6-metoxy-1,4-benzoquinol methylase